MPRYVCCVPGCSVIAADGVPLHCFPNPETFAERFQIWVKNIGGDLASLDSATIHKSHRVCRRHFESVFLYPKNRLSTLAVPTLLLSTGDILKGMLEVCIDSLESAINAIHGGADELELCSSLTEGGLTPSPGLVKQIMEMVNNIETGKPIRKSCHECGCDKLKKRPKVNVMIRCRTGSDFHYSEEEMDTMLSDVDVFKHFGVDRFVFGALTDTLHIDEINCERLIKKADPIPVTFHRAFDVCIDPLSSVSKIIGLGFNRLLTSGQKSSASEIEAIQLIKSLISSVGDKIEIMPGAGINPDNAKTFIEMGCNIIHSSCKRIKYLPQIMNGLSMGTNDSEHIFVTDEDIVRKMKNFIS